MNKNFFEALQFFNFNDEAWDERSKRPPALEDRRLSSIYHTDYRYTPVHYTDLEVWKKRKMELQEQILMSAGLWPLPEKCKLNSRIFDKKVYDGFSVEKVIFESYPGFYVTGNLFRPSVTKGIHPAILNAHGHWDNGRLEQSDFCDIPTRCANFAKMGFIALAYDMIGYQDSMQINHQYGGTKQELWSIGAFGIQLWNSIRCIDFIETLTDVDTSRIGCTGASGGATQTFFLTAVDERIKAAVPVNMVSATMQGGCSCEGAPGLRIGTNNVEIACLTAPRPMLLIGSTGDWTDNTPVVEYPAVHSVYSLYGKSHQVEYFYHDAGHNYNKKAREKAYNWFARKFLDKDIDWSEQEIDFGDINALRIFSENDKPGGVKSNLELFQIQKSEKANALKKLWDTDRTNASLITRKAMKRAFGVQQPSSGVIESHMVREDIDGFDISRAIIGTEANGEQIPITVVNRKGCGNKNIILLIHPEGKKSAFEDDGWKSMVESLLDKGFTVVSADLFLTGEFHRHGSLSGRNTGISRHFTTYNHTDIALRVQDIVTVFKYLRQKYAGEIRLGSMKEAGLWCLSALPFLEDLKSALIDCSGLDMHDEGKYAERFFVPGFLAAGGFDSSVRLSIPNELMLFNVKNDEDIRFIKNIFNDDGNKTLKVFDNMLLNPWQE